MAAASRSLATALWGARFASGLLQPSYTTNRDTTASACQCSLVIVLIAHWTRPSFAAGAVALER